MVVGAHGRVGCIDGLGSGRSEELGEEHRAAARWRTATHNEVNLCGHRRRDRRGVALGVRRVDQAGCGSLRCA